jgi:D-beta-D-heptose 7-phosphate kinase/D-beta-D-heptose 1-phosphate adenosyltransferase
MTDTLLKALSQTNILVLGDVMLDTFVFGEVERISPEAPVPILNKISSQDVLGGAGNVLRNLVGLGGPGGLVSVIGEDESGRQLKQLVNELNLENVTLLCDRSDRKTSHKTRFLAHQQLLRVDSETTLPVAWEGPLRKGVSDAIKGSHGVILSDYAKGFCTPEVCQGAIALAKAEGKPVFVDPKGTDWERYRGATILTPNKKELITYVGRPLNDLTDCEEAARQVLAQLNIGAILVTLGAHGMLLVRKDGPAFLEKATAQEVYDVSGAGDTVISVLSALVTGGISLERAVHVANIAAGIVVGKLGTAAIYVDDLLHALDTECVLEKIMTLPMVLDRVAKWNRHQKSIGFTNGCFDLIHPGHLSLLSQSRSQCDVLIVGLNSDASIKRLKGPDRPIHDQDARAAVLAALSMVDAVVVFDEDTPEQLIKAIVPHVLIKGADYTEDQVVGGDLVKKAGGRVFLAQLVPGRSTTRTVDKLKG